MNRDIPWKIHRTWPGLFSFIIIGFMAGMFGLGAGWANVPVLNLLMGAPLKISVATSKFLLSITDTSAAWIYLNKGAVIPMMMLPSLIGIMLDSLVGVRILKGGETDIHPLDGDRNLVLCRAQSHQQGFGKLRCHFF